MYSDEAFVPVARATSSRVGRGAAKKPAYVDLSDLEDSD